MASLQGWQLADPVPPYFQTGGDPLAPDAALLLASLNLADLLNAAAARINLGLGASALRDVGTVAGTVAAGDDPRFAGAASAAGMAALAAAVARNAAQLAAKGAAYGLAPLDALGRVPAANLPASAGGAVSAADVLAAVGGMTAAQLTALRALLGGTASPAQTAAPLLGADGAPLLGADGAPLLAPGVSAAPLMTGSDGVAVTGQDGMILTPPAGA